MPETMGEPPTTHLEDPLVRDLVTFVKIVERVHEERTHGLGRRADPALNAAFGLQAAWNTLVEPYDDTVNMPVLRERTARFLATQGLTMQTVSALKTPAKKLAYMSFDILTLLYRAIPSQYRNDQLLEKVDGLHQRKIDTVWNGRLGQLILLGLQVVLPEQDS